MILDFLTEEQCQTVREWRNQCLESLRTSRALSPDEQSNFYWNRISNPNSPHRYWALKHPWFADKPDMRFLGMGGLTYICWENRIAEISLIIDPDARKQGFGMQAVDLLLAEAFDHMGLKTVYGECYHCNPALSFWHDVATRYNAYIADLPNRKFWAGTFHDSFYFSIDAAMWRSKVRG